MGRYKNLLLMHGIVFIWGFTGILGNEIHLDALSLVWWRTLVAAIALGAFMWFTGRSFRSSPLSAIKMMAVGLITALHWICFFGSIKTSNISIALAVLSTSSFFVAIISPLIRKEKFRPYELILGVALVVGIGIILQFESDKSMGVYLSLASAFFAALFSTINSTLVRKHPPTQIAFYEMLAACVGVFIALLYTGGVNAGLFEISFLDGFYIFLLGAVATAMAYVIGIEVMKELSPFTCSVAVNMEPVYTILFALWIYKESEYMTMQFYLGLLIIVGAVFLDAWLKYRKSGSAISDKPGMTGTAQ